MTLCAAKDFPSLETMVTLINATVAYKLRRYDVAIKHYQLTVTQPYLGFLQAYDGDVLGQEEVLDVCLGDGADVGDKNLQMSSVCLKCEVRLFLRKIEVTWAGFVMAAREAVRSGARTFK